MLCFVGTLLDQMIFYFIVTNCLSFQAHNNPNKEKIMALCKMRGMINDDVDELNELSETRLISAAAEGKSMAELRLLVHAGANVNGARPDGVTAIWLAAQVL
jgi:hypothetical protein